MSRTTSVLSSLPQILFILAACLALLVLSGWAWPFNLPDSAISRPDGLGDQQGETMSFAPANLSLPLVEAANQVNVDASQAGGP